MPEDDVTLPPCQIWWGWRSLLLCSASEGSGKGISSYETQLVKTCKKCITSWFYWWFWWWSQVSILAPISLIFFRELRNSFWVLNGVYLAGHHAIMLTIFSLPWRCRLSHILCCSLGCGTPDKLSHPIPPTWLCTCMNTPLALYSSLTQAFHKLLCLMKRF